jgi:phytoene desaturase
MSRSVVIVGAGLGGLAAAIRLRAAGCDVTLVEREGRPGGRAGRIERDGYAFDTGPTVLTMPHLVDELFRLTGESFSDAVTLQRLDPAYRAVFHDGSVLHVRAGVDAMADEVADVCGHAEADRFRRLAGHLHQLYEAEYGTFIDAQFDGVGDLVKPAALARLIRLGGFRRLDALVGSFLSDWRLQRVFTFQAMYAGMSPFQALGVYAVIAYMDTIAGVYYPRGGVYAVSRALADLAVRAGVDLRLGTSVEAVEVVNGRAVAVRTEKGDRLAADVVVVNADLPAAYRDLLPAEVTPRRVRKLRYSPSCVVVHLGLSERVQGAAHHNVHFARSFSASFDDILNGRMQRDASWFLTVPTVTDATLAPDGAEVGYYLLPTPNLQTNQQLNWDAQGPREVERALDRLQAAGYGDVRAATVVREVVTPADWGRRGMAAGTPFAASHHFLQTGPFRPANVAPRVRGLVFAGSSTTPGVGVPMVLVSGKLAAQRVMQQLDAA